MAMALNESEYCLLLCSLCKNWRRHRDSGVIRIRFRNSDFRFQTCILVAVYLFASLLMAPCDSA